MKTGFAAKGFLFLSAAVIILAACSDPEPEEMNCPCASGYACVDDACVKHDPGSPNRKLDELLVLSSIPVVEETAPDFSRQYAPLCRAPTEDPDGVIFNVLMQGTMKKSTPPDQDLSLKPGDYVSGQQIAQDGLTPELLELSIKCVDQLPDPDPHQCNSGILGDDLDTQQVDFYRYGDPDADPLGNVAVAILIDMSGSMKGLSDPFPPYKEDTFENFTQVVPEGFSFSDNATDPGGSRMSAVETLIKTLNDDDPVIVFTFNEYKIDIVCKLPDQPDADYAKKEEKCFGTNRELVLGGPEGFSLLDAIKGDERGRTPLWTAVDKVVDFMLASSMAENASFRHILVITDGPDTCSPSADLNECSGLCMQYHTEYEMVRANITESEWSDRIPVHFVQLGAKGYPERDPLQQEMACLTGGHYVFVNAHEIPPDSLLAVLEMTLRRVRYTFRGYWRLAVELSVMQKSNEPDSGRLHALGGWGKLLSGAERLFTNNEEFFRFDYGEDQTSPYFDRRVSVRKECTPDSDACPSEEPYNECSTTRWWCDEETLTCRSARAWEDNGEISSCKPRDTTLVVGVKEGNSRVSTEIAVFGMMPTVCCRGRCMPPAPPEPPDELKQPEGMASACFYYTIDGWVLEDPGAPDSAWVTYATLKLSDQCTWQPFQEFFDSHAPPSPGDFPGGWEYCLKDHDGDNCYPPSGE